MPTAKTGPKNPLSEDFRRWILSLAEARELTLYSLALEAQIDGSQLRRSLGGQISMSDETMRAIAPHLGLDPQELIIRANIDRLGGIEEIKRYMPEAWPVTAQEPAAPPYVLPPGVAPLTKTEQTVVAQLARIAPLGEQSLGPSASVWVEPPRRRLALLREALDLASGDETGEVRA